jgi:hypothetical protein
LATSFTSALVGVKLVIIIVSIIWVATITGIQTILALQINSFEQAVLHEQFFPRSPRATIMHNKQLSCRYFLMLQAFQSWLQSGMFRMLAIKSCKSFKSCGVFTKKGQSSLLLR